MPIRLDTVDAGFETAFRSFLDGQRGPAGDVGPAVAGIIADVRTRGDEAVFEATQRLDGLTLSVDNLRVPAAEIDAATAKVPQAERDALKLAAERIEAYHRRQVPANEQFADEAGLVLGHRWTALAAVGLYVPGSKAAYPSSVLMNAIPARVAGVGRVAMTVPAPGGTLNPLVLAAARIVGVDEIYRIGGAQAVAALAYGTASIPAVDKIVGPGNAYVAEAKRQVFGVVGIDMIAGPSEVLVIADADNDPTWIAADLLSQAEHDEAAQAILITTDAAFADAVAHAVDSHLETLERAAIAGASWRDHGALICVRDLAEAADLADRIAPEHLELALDDAESFAGRVRNAGAIFLGRYTPEAIGDYVAGPSHVLPTARSARFASGLSVLDFVKRTSIVRCDPASLQTVGPAAATLADAEGLGAHALSVRARLGDAGGR